MPSPRFFAPLQLRGADAGIELPLPDAVAHHALRVLRLGPGDRLTLFTGEGGEYEATLTRAGKREAWARIDAFHEREREPPLAVTLVQAIAASDTMDVVVRRAVELGAAAIQPVESERSARFPAGAQGDKRHAHWRQVAVAACEQCGRNRVPPVRDAMTFAQWLAARAASPGVIFAPDAGNDLASLPAPGDTLDVVIGPEGGFVAHELAAGERAELRAARLGPRILRADTASLAALSVVQFLWGDLR
ncbi:MAG: 16S rRNA (uracil(1498)-N(3))-methyltransferase [Burkholderiales bacterium]|nr:16S rRNA (uracil(1498)-N(3))-methyltransferase [Burkholderiales bacterium]